MKTLIFLYFHKNVNDQSIEIQTSGYVQALGYASRVKTKKPFLMPSDSAYDPL